MELWPDSFWGGLYCVLPYWLWVWDTGRSPCWCVAGGMEMKKVHGALSFCTKRQQQAVGALRAQSFYQQIESVFFYSVFVIHFKTGYVTSLLCIKLQEHTREQSSLHPKTIFDNASYFRLYLATRGLFQGRFSHYNRIGCFSNPQIPQMYS